MLFAGTFAGTLILIYRGKTARIATSRESRPARSGGLAKGLVLFRRELSNRDLRMKIWVLRRWLLVALLLGATPLFAATVTSTADFGKGTLRYAILNAISGETITFALPSGSVINLTGGELLVNKNLTINGPGANLLSVQRSAASGTPAFRIFNIASGNFNVTISSLMIANGNTTDSYGGGGIFNNSTGTVNVANSIVSSNTAPIGGGIVNNATGMVNVTNSIVSSNSAVIGGGMLNQSGGYVSVTNSIISGNSTSSGDGGGGIYNTGRLTITYSTISGNNAQSGRGGGIYDTGHGMFVEKCTISGNSASGSYGGGIYNDSATAVTITDSTISGNAASFGGGMFSFGTVNVTNCTFSANSAVTIGSTSGVGGGISNGNGTVNVRNTIIAKNTAANGGPDYNGMLTSQGYNLIGNSSGGGAITPLTGDQIGTAASPIDPLLGPLQDNGGATFTQALLFGSKAIDGGHSSGSATDQRGTGFPRTFNDPNVPNASGGDGADNGAFELQTVAPTPAPGTLANISTRLQVGTGNNVLFAGFIVKGTVPKKVIIRSAGPSLTPFGITGALANPRLELHDANNTIGTNDNWQTTQLGGVITSDQVAAIGMSGAAPANPQEPAIIATLAPGSYTAIVNGVGDTQGIATVELYDLSPNNGAVLANISTRGLIQTGNQVMIGGFIVSGQPTKVVIRATGPSLVPFGIPNALPNPRLELHDSNGALIGKNDDWQTTQLGGIITSDQSAAIQSSGLAPSNAKESAIIATLPPGSYTAISQDVNGATGVGLLEVYAVE